MTIAGSIVTLVVGVSIAVFFMWTAENGRRADHEREWGKRD
ncbi:hypothetical protein OKW34_000171 [Paraburkholderia youngii]